MTMVRITDMFKECSFGMGGNARCRQPATSAVIDSNGNRWWRCGEHEGLLHGEVARGVVYEIEEPCRDTAPSHTATGET
jgi:hypothetical protein